MLEEPSIIVFTEGDSIVKTALVRYAETPEKATKKTIKKDSIIKCNIDFIFKVITKIILNVFYVIMTNNIYQ